MTQYSVNGIKLPSSSPKPKLVVTPEGPANGTLIDGTYQTLTVRVTSNPPTTPVTGTNVTIYVNGAPICTNQSSPSTGLVSCPYEAKAQGTYRWNGTAQKPGTFDPAVAPQPTFTFTAGPRIAITLVAGWNLFSIPFVPANTLVIKVLAAQVAANDFTIIWSYHGGKWSSATPSKGKISGSLTSIADGFSFWIYMTHADTLYVTGSVLAPPPATPPTYTLTAGWNLLGFKPQPNPAASEQLFVYLTSISGKYDPTYVWVYDNTSQSWIRANSSYMIQPGQAMWILMTAPATLRP